MTHTGFRPWLLAAAAITATTCASVLTPDAAPEPQDPPRVRLRLSGQLEGRLEPCGCASAQIGGLARRSFTNRQDRGYDLLIEGGNRIAGGGTVLDDFKLLTMMQVFDNQHARYDALGVGALDLALGTPGLDLVGEFQVPAVASDLMRSEDADSAPVRPFVEKSTPEATVRIASLTLSPLDGYRLLSPAAAWQRALEGAASETLRILLVHGTREQAEAQAGLDPKPDLIVAIGRTYLEPPAAAVQLDGVPLVFPGAHGRYLLDVTLTRVGEEPEIRSYRPIPLAGSRTAKGAMEDESARALILQHRHDVAESRLREEMAERMPVADGLSYVGSQACAACHAQAYQVWTESKHGHAWKTLEEAESSGRYPWPVPKYPDCIECHTVAYGFESGFISPEQTPALAGVGCEACHGPGSAHVQNPIGARFPLKGRENCLTCHNYEQSPEFDYAKRWQTIQHGK